MIMKTAVVLLALAAITSSIPADTEGAPASVKTEVSIDALKKQLTASLQEDIENIRKSDANPRSTASLENILQDIQGDMWDSSIESLDLFYRRMIPKVSTSGGSPKSSALLEECYNRSRREFQSRLENMETQATLQGKEILRKALASANLEEIHDLQAKWKIAIKPVRCGQNSTLPGEMTSLDNFLESLGRFRSVCDAKSWTAAVQSFSQISKSLPQLGRFINAEETKAYLDKTRKELGILPPAEMQRVMRGLLDELFDDANQDMLDEVKAKIQKMRSLTENPVNGAWDEAIISQSRSLNDLATSFTLSVQQVKNGSPSRFQAVRDPYNQPALISQADLERRLANYKVKIVEPGGGIRIEPMRLEAGEILRGITSLADLQAALPNLRKACRQASANPEETNWSYLLTQLEWIAETHAMLESELPFVLSREIRGYQTSGTQPAAPEKFNDLVLQIQLAILHRCLPHARAKEGESSFRKVLFAVLDGLKREGKFEDMLTANQIAVAFTPGQPVISSQESAAIKYYLAGVRQDDMLAEPRFAAYFLHNAAATKSSVLPLDDIKSRLQKIKTQFPADYQKGMDDCLKGGLESPMVPQSAFPYSASQLMIPGKRE